MFGTAINDGGSLGLSFSVDVSLRIEPEQSVKISPRSLQKRGNIGFKSTISDRIEFIAGGLCLDPDCGPLVLSNQMLLTWSIEDTFRKVQGLILSAPFKRSIVSK